MKETRNEVRLLLDGGGSSLKIWRDTQGKRLLLQTRSGNFNVNTGEHLRIVKMLAEAVKRYPATRVSIGLAGLTELKDKQQLRNAVIKRLSSSAPALEFKSDLELAFDFHFQTEDGIIVVLGTGSVFAASVKKKSVRKLIQVGGYGRLCDAGSGVAIGNAAVILYFKLLDGFFKDAAFESAMKKNFPNRAVLIEKIYRRSFPVQSLAPVIFELAAARNPAAIKVLQHETREVISYLKLLLKKLPKPASPYAMRLCGGLVAEKNPYREMLKRRIKTETGCCVKFAEST